jgi:cation diffusion facilitator family transporter
VESPSILKPQGKSHKEIRSEASGYALASTIFLTLLKLSVGVLSGSAAVFSEGLHSSLDLVSAGLSFFTVREAGKPADDDHPYGHGKIETFSSLIEALFLVIAAGAMIFEGYLHIKDPQPLQYQGLAILTIFVSLVVSYFMYRHNKKAAATVESSALHVNALHFLTDVMASGAILLGLLVLKFTNWLIIDALLAFAVAAYILVVSARQVRVAVLELLDTQLPEEEIHHIREMLTTFKDRMIEAHDLRTRRSGSTRHIDFHLVCCGAMSVSESHSVCDQIEAKILEEYPSASVNIHVEPCEPHKTNCRATCQTYGSRETQVEQQV